MAQGAGAGAWPEESATPTVPGQAAQSQPPWGWQPGDAQGGWGQQAWGQQQAWPQPGQAQGGGGQQQGWGQQAAEQPAGWGASGGSWHQVPPPRGNTTRNALIGAVGVLVAAAVVVTLLLVLLGGKSDHYTAATMRGYIGSCERAGGPSPYCKCTYNWFTAHVPYSTFKKGASNLQTLSPQLHAAAAACQGQLQPGTNTGGGSGTSGSSGKGTSGPGSSGTSGGGTTGNGSSGSGPNASGTS